MNDYTFTEKGAEWVANRIISSRDTKDIDTMYIVYTNGTKSRLDLDKAITVDDLLDSTGEIWCMKKSGGVIGYITSDGSGNTFANISCAVTKDDVVKGGTAEVELSADTSKIIAVAVAISGQPDSIIAACNITKDGAAAPIKWVDNMAISVSCPIGFY